MLLVSGKLREDLILENFCLEKYRNSSKERFFK